MNNESTQDTLKSWATGKVTMIAIGLVIGYFLYEQGVLQKLTSKLFSKKENG